MTAAPSAPITSWYWGITISLPVSFFRKNATALLKATPPWKRILRPGALTRSCPTELRMVRACALHAPARRSPIGTRFLNLLIEVAERTAQTELNSVLDS